LSDLVIKNVTLADGRGGEPYSANVYIKDGVVSKVEACDSQNGAKGESDFTREFTSEKNNPEIIDGRGLVCAPGFVDLHVHFRDPGFTEKEDVVSGGRAAAAGGFTTVCCMPNTRPAIHNADVLADIDRCGREAGNVNLFALSAMTVNQAGNKLADFAAMDEAITLCHELTGHGICGITEDGKTLANDDLMRGVLAEAKRLGLLVMDHAEPEAEIVLRDIEFARGTDAHIHIQHVSTEAAVRALREAKKDCPNITCETAPHYFALTSKALDKIGANAKMNPPLRTERDREAIIEGIADGTIDIIATDHAPHTSRDKSKPMDEAPFGIVGLETCFSLAYTYLVKTGVLTFAQLIDKMSGAPARLINLDRGIIAEGKSADITLLDISHEGVIDSTKFHSKGRNTPFDVMRVNGRVEKTLLAGKVTYERN
jgi:dihydroorotase